MRRIVPKSLRHPWLNAKDPANCINGKGYWVPRPEEIELKCELARDARYKGDGQDERRQYRSPKQVIFFAQREVKDQFPLCDCPYWGTDESYTPEETDK